MTHGAVGLGQEREEALADELLLVVGHDPVRAATEEDKPKVRSDWVALGCPARGRQLEGDRPRGTKGEVREEGRDARPPAPAADHLVLEDEAGEHARVARGPTVERCLLEDVVEACAKGLARDRRGEVSVGRRRGRGPGELRAHAPGVV